MELLNYRINYTDKLLPMTFEVDEDTQLIIEQ